MRNIWRPLLRGCAGFFQNGVKHGYGIYTWSTGDTYEGEYVDDFKHGLCVCVCVCVRLRLHLRLRACMCVGVRGGVRGAESWEIIQSNISPREFERWHALTRKGE